MSNYVALRGKLEWIPETKANAPSTNASTQTQQTGNNRSVNSDSCWQWTGVWAFGDKIIDYSGAQQESMTTRTQATKSLLQAQQPFQYKWQSKTAPHEVLVPSAIQPTLDETTDTDPAEHSSEATQKSSRTANEKVTSNQVESNETNAENATSAGGGVATGESVKTDDATSLINKSGGTSKKATRQQPRPRSPLEPSRDAKAKEEDTAIPASNATATAEVSTSDCQGDVKEASNSRDDISKTSEKEPLSKLNDKSIDTTQSETIVGSGTNLERVAQGQQHQKQKEPTAEQKLKQELITFATMLPGDPPFTDAAEYYERKATTTGATSTTESARKCPPSGQWEGYFQNATGRNRDRLHRVSEQFYLFFNATPGPNASSVFDDEVTPNDTGNILAEGQVHVSGMGDNQFGTFEIIGMLDLETKMLEIQRKYVALQEGPSVNTSPSGRTTGRRSSSSSSIASSTVVTRHKSSRPYYTRKRQMSWKRKSIYDDEQSSHPTPSSGSSSIMPGRRKKKPKSSPTSAPPAGPSPMSDPTGTTVGTGPASGLTITSAVGPTMATTAPEQPMKGTDAAPGLSGMHPQLAHAAAGSSAGKKAIPTFPGDAALVPSGPGLGNAIAGGGAPTMQPSPSPKQASLVSATQVGEPADASATGKASSATGTARKRALSVGSPQMTPGDNPVQVTVSVGAAPPAIMQSSSATTTASTSLSSSPYLKLPPVGDPKKARWRSAHFLYYQRHDPSDESPNGPTNSTSSTNTSSHGSMNNNSYSSSMAAAAAAASTSLYGGGGSNTNNNHHSHSNSNNSNNGGHSNLPNNPRYVIYEGEMFDSKREGRGICLYSNGMLYEGSWKRDKEHGKGKLMTADRQRIIYEGDFERGRMQGVGTYYYAQAENSLSSPSPALTTSNTAGGSGSTRGHKGKPSGSTSSDEKIVGNKANVARKDGNCTPEDVTNVKSNKAEVVDDAGSRYHGDFKENMRNGYGKYIFPDGSVYTGMWREGMMSGRGVFTWPDCSVYDGEWKDGKRHGQGLLKASDGFLYEGMWVQNAMEGRGSAVYPGGQRYDGMFSNGRREGRGTIVFTNGAVYEGRFRDDAISGQGTMKMSKTIIVPQGRKRTETSDDTSADQPGQQKHMASEDSEASEATESTKQQSKSKDSAAGVVELKEEQPYDDTNKQDYMIPIAFQSDMTHIHAKAGFTAIGH